MRCEDCLPLVEEYFDGEVEGKTAAQMGAHLSACATCAAALDALSFEQEIYTRYDRGLEVAPNLWARVSAEIAREPHRETPAPTRPFLIRVRDRFAAALGALGARPALASSLALLLLGVTAGSLWLAQRGGTEAPQEMASNDAPGGVAPAVPFAPSEARGGAPAETTSTVAGSLPAEGSLSPQTGGSGLETSAPLREGSREAADGRRPVTITIAPGIVAAEDDIQALLASPSAPQANPNIVTISADEHAAGEGSEALLLNASLNAPAAERDAFAGGARPPDPAEKDVARHVERTQMLLRSFKNARAADEGQAADLAYEKEFSRTLLAENATLQLEAEVKGDKETKQVLDQIEPFLLDIANLRERPSREEVRSIKERVRKNEIVAALQVY